MDLFDILSSLVERNLDLESTGTVSVSSSTTTKASSQFAKTSLTPHLALFVTSEQCCEDALKILKGKD